MSNIYSEYEVIVSACKVFDENPEPKWNGKSECISFCGLLWIVWRMIPPKPAYYTSLNDDWHALWGRKPLNPSYYTNSCGTLYALLGLQFSKPVHYLNSLMALTISCYSNKTITSLASNLLLIFSIPKVLAYVLFETSTQTPYKFLLPL